MENLKRTILYDWHKSHGAKIVPFGGFEMPLYYSSIIKEHLAVRNSVGIFDVSHMGEVVIRGDKALDFVNYLLPAKLKGIPHDQVKYSFFLKEDGGIVDDLLVYPLRSDYVMLVINAGNIDKDIAHIKSKLPNDLELLPLKFGNIAVQGPQSEEFLSSLFNFSLSSIKFYHFRKNDKIGNTDVIISHTGYTGDDGFEIYAEEQYIPQIWERIFEKNPIAAGLGARDTLRLEAGFPLYGHELSENINPIEARLSSFIEWEKDFIGRDALLKIKKEGPGKILIGFEVSGGVPRQGYKIYKNSQEIGFVTSGEFSPALKKMIGMGYVNRDEVNEGDPIFIEIRNNKKEAKIIKRPFYKRNRR